MASDNQIALAEVLGLLSRLVAKSLVIAELGAREQSMRYRMLQTLRDFGLERLAERGELYAVRDRHAEYCLQLANFGRGVERGNRAKSWLERLQPEQDNLAVALGWLIDNGLIQRALQLANELGEFWFITGQFSEGRRWLSKVLSMPGGDGVGRALLLRQLGRLAWAQADFPIARQALEAALPVLLDAGEL